MSNKAFIIGVIAAIAVVLPFAMADSLPAQAAGVTVSGTLVSPTSAALSQAGGFVNLQPDGPYNGAGGNIEPDGTFSIPNVEAGKYNVNINYGGFDGDFTGPAPFSINVGSSAINLGNIKLTTPSITGVVTEPDGTTPVGNTWVQIRTDDWSFNQGTNADENGNFKFGGLPTGTFTLEAQAPPQSQFTSAEQTVTYSGTALTGVVVSLTSPNVMGTVKDPSGNALVLTEGQWIGCDMNNQDWSVNRNSQVDENGVFRFGTVPSGSYTIGCRPEGLPYTATVPKTVSVTSGTLLNVGTLKLTTPQLQGVVYAPDGATPVRDAWVNVHNDDWSVNQGSNTNEQGQYTIGGLSAGTYSIEVNSPWGTNYISPDPVQVTIGSTLVTKNLTFVNATKFLSGTVKKSDGTAVAGAQVNANKEGGFGWANAQTDANGSYQVALSGGFWNIMVNPDMGPGAPPADWFYSGPPQRVDFANDSTTENKTLNITVTIANSAVVGRVLKADGSPLSDANVDVRNQEGGGNNAPVQPDGSFDVRVSAGTYKLFVWTPDNTLTFDEMSVTVGDGQTLDVGTLTAKEKLGRITGKVVSSTGEGIPNVRMNAWKHDGPGWSDTQSDASGNFSLAVTDGRWGVNIDQGGNARYVYSGPPLDVDVRTETSTVDLGNIALTYADATITGFVVDDSDNVITGFCGWAEARPNATTSVFGFGPGYGSPVDCQSGEFTIYVPSSVASTYSLAVHTPPNSEYSPLADQNVAVFADTTSTKNIVLKRNDATVQGQLYDQNGVAVTSCVSSFGWFGDVHFEKQGSWRGGEIRPDCTYSISLLSGDDYHMGYWIEPRNGFMMKPPDPTPLTIAAGVTTMNITVNKADATITGQVLDPDGNGIDAWVFAG